MKCGNGEFFVIPVDFVIAENKRKCIKLIARKLFSRKSADKLKLFIGQSVCFVFLRNYSPLFIFSACAL